MKTILSLCMLILVVGAFAQGPLQPSSSVDTKVGPISPLTGGGQPQPTMKTLHQVEPRIPLVAGSPGVTISAGGNITIGIPGSYYLTGNLTVASGNGITINQNPVTLDLNGFNISSTSNPASGYGIFVSAASHAVVIRDGTILSSGQVSSSALTLSGAGFEYGVLAYQPFQTHISHLTIGGTSSWAIFTENADANLVDHCTVRDCVSGIHSGTIENCTATRIPGNALFGQIVTSSFAKSYIGDGINGTVVNGCDGRTLTNNSASTACGIRAPLSGGLVTNSRGVTGAASPSNSKSILSGIAVGCAAVGETSIVNRYNMPASP